MMTSPSAESAAREILPEFEHSSAESVLQWALERFSPNIALACSFQAEESVLIDMMQRQRGADFRIFTLDTGRLNQETYDCMDAIRERYGISVEVYFPNAGKVEDMVRAHGLNLFYQSVERRQLRCGVRKVELDKDHGDIVKINPLADWSNEQVWIYMRERNIPFNWLHTQGYSSIGCAPCTRAVKPGEDSRAGLWWWEDSEKKECGLHFHTEASVKQNFG